MSFANPSNSPHDERTGDHKSHVEVKSPSSTISSGYGQAIGPFPTRDESLPEVALDTSPEVVSPLELEQKRKFLESNAPQTYISMDEDTNKIVVPIEHNAIPESVKSDSRGAGDSRSNKDVDGDESTTKKASTIMGLRRKNFFIVLIIVVIVLAAAIGGGVGGGLSAKSKSQSKSDSNSAADAASTSSSTSTEAPTSSESPTSSKRPTTTATTTTASATKTTTTTKATSATPTVSFLNNQTDSSNRFAFQAFSDDTFGGKASKIIHDEDGTNFDFDVHSYVWAPNITNCCVTFCANATSKGMIGWYCSQRKQPKSSDAFRRIFVWCKDEHKQQNAVCI